MYGIAVKCCLVAFHLLRLLIFATSVGSAAEVEADRWSRSAMKITADSIADGHQERAATSCLNPRSNCDYSSDYSLAHDARFNLFFIILNLFVARLFK